MFLVVEFEDGSTGRYPLSAQSTVTIQEPNVQLQPGVESPGPRFDIHFGLVTGVSLEQGEISPEPEAPGASADITPTLTALIPPLRPDVPPDSGPQTSQVAGPIPADDGGDSPKSSLSGSVVD